MLLLWKIHDFVEKFNMHKTECVHITRWCLPRFCTPKVFNMSLFTWIRFSKLESGWTASFGCNFAFPFLADTGNWDEYVIRLSSNPPLLRFFFFLIYCEQKKNWFKILQTHLCYIIARRDGILLSGPSAIHTLARV